MRNISLNRSCNQTYLANASVERRCGEIYSFDKKFDQLKDVTRLPKFPSEAETNSWRLETPIEESSIRLLRALDFIVPVSYFFAR